MAVDNEILSNIRDQDVGALVGVPNMAPDHAEAIYYGMRKAMLKYAASSCQFLQTARLYYYFELRNFA